MSHEKSQPCIDACNACVVTCGHCLNGCLAEDDVKMLAHCIRLDIDCSAICLLAVHYMSRGSEFARQICALCADVCDACAAECEKHDHEHCRNCAQACRKCAEECRKMI